MYLDGSRMLHERACAIGVTNQFYTFNNAPHVPYLSNAAYMDSTERFVRDFLVEVMGCTQTVLLPANEMQQQAFLYPTTYCDGTPSNEACSSVATDELYMNNELACYPNPNNGNFTIQTNNGFESLRIYNVSGVLIYESKGANLPSFEVGIQTEVNGLYLVEVQFKNKQILRTKIQLLR
jgi:hypothetical protein